MSNLKFHIRKNCNFQKNRKKTRRKQNFIQRYRCFVCSIELQNCHELFKWDLLCILQSKSNPNRSTQSDIAVQFLLKLHTQTHARVCIRPIPSNVSDFCIHRYPFYCTKSRAISFSIYILITRYGDSEFSELEMTFNR